MTKKQITFIEMGFIKDSQGLKGEWKLSLKGASWDWIEKVEEFRVVLNLTPEKMAWMRIHFQKKWTDFLVEHFIENTRNSQDIRKKNLKELLDSNSKENFQKNSRSSSAKATADKPANTKQLDRSVQLEFLFNLYSARESGKDFVIRAEGFDDRTLCDFFRGASFLIPENAMESDEGETLFLKEILGYSVVDQFDEHQGDVADFEFNGVYDLLVTNKNNKRIPFVEEFIVDIDHKNKVIFMKLPEGI